MTPPVRIDPYEAVKRIIVEQAKSTVVNTEPWYSLNRAIRIIWQLTEEAKEAAQCPSKE